MQTIHDRIHQRMTQLHLKQADICKATGASRTAVSHWISGRSAPSAVKLDRLAASLQTTTGWLLYGDAEGIDALAPEKQGAVQSLNPVYASRQIPVLSWIQAGDWGSGESIVDTKNCHFVPVFGDVSKNAFALVVDGYSMSPEYMPGDFIVVNPDVSVNDLSTGDLVVVSNEVHDATFKRIVFDNGHPYLTPINPDWHGPRFMPLTDGCRLVGKVEAMYRKMR